MSHKRLCPHTKQWINLYPLHFNSSSCFRSLFCDLLVALLLWHHRQPLIACTLAIAEQHWKRVKIVFMAAKLGTLDPDVKFDLRQNHSLVSEQQNLFRNICLPLDWAGMRRDSFCKNLSWWFKDLIYTFLWRWRVWKYVVRLLGKINYIL